MYITKELDLTSLRDEQHAVQKSKAQSRGLDHYGEYFFDEYTEGFANTIAHLGLGKFLQDRYNSKTKSIEAVLQALIEQKNGTIHWVDVGTGYAIAQRQANQNEKLRENLRTTAVDLFDYGNEDGESSDKKEIAEFYGTEILDDQFKPDLLLLEDAEKLHLGKKADIITCIETFQYLENPLQTMANLYNQLSDNGLLVIASQNPWLGYIKYDENMRDAPSVDIVKALSENDIAFGLSQQYLATNHLMPALGNGLMISKKPNTKMSVNSRPTKRYINPFDFKVTYYEQPEKGKDLIEITASQSE